MRTPWSEKTVVYHIYVRSFKDSNGDGIGDLGGVIEKLNYLNDSTDGSLGVDAIWLSPVYPSPNADFGYDISDYKNINPEYGDLEIFKKLLEEAHNRGIKVLMDFVPNHTSDEHKWFLESKSSKDNSKRDYYIWKDPKEDGSPPNNWISTCGGSAWEYDEITRQYYLHSFYKKQPDLNWRNPEVVIEMLNNFRFWLDLGVDGFRVDVPEFIFKDQDFRDEPPNPDFNHDWPDKFGSLLHIYTQGLLEVIPMFNKFVGVLEEYEDKFMVVEVWTTFERMVQMYSEVGRKLFTPFNFSLVELPWEMNQHKKFIDRYDGALGSLYYPNYVLGNHDKSRIASRIGKEKIRLAAVLELTLRGIPFIYYGEEIGMENGVINQDQIKDSIELVIPGIGLGRDPERTPMQWNGSESAGFSASKSTWLPLASNYPEINVENQQADPLSMLSLYKVLIDLRQNQPALQFGKYVSINVGNDSVFVYTRTFENEIILVLLNYSADNLEIGLPFREGKILIETNMHRNGEVINLERVQLGSYQAMVIKI